MSLSVGRAKLTGASKELMLRWDKARMSWNDDRARQLQEEFLEPVERTVKSAVSAMERVMAVVEKARRECGWRPLTAWMRLIGPLIRIHCVDDVRAQQDGQPSLETLWCLSNSRPGTCTPP
jgi:hypothetical protein